MTCKIRIYLASHGIETSAVPCNKTIGGSKDLALVDKLCTRNSGE